MENTVGAVAVTKRKNAGALPHGKRGLSRQTVPQSKPSDIEAPVTEHSPREGLSDKPSAGSENSVRHVRCPAIKRSGVLLLMLLCAVCGTAAGAAGIFSGAWTAEGGFLFFRSDNFLGIFLTRLVYGGAFLLAEYLLGFSALGDLAVWSVPLLCGMSTAVSFTAADSSAWLLPSAGAVLAAAVFGAAASADFSAMLLRVARGGNVFLHEKAAREYSLKYVGYIAAVVFAGLYEAAIKTCGLV